MIHANTKRALDYLSDAESALQSIRIDLDELESQQKADPEDRTILAQVSYVTGCLEHIAKECQTIVEINKNKKGSYANRNS